jgi:hypothetical protein
MTNAANTRKPLLRAFVFKSDARAIKIVHPETKRRIESFANMAAFQ